MTPWSWETPFHKFNGCRSGGAADSGLHQAITGVFGPCPFSAFGRGTVMPASFGRSGKATDCSPQHQRVKTRPVLIVNASAMERPTCSCLMLP
ncbi:MAG: hypothetical protein OXC82_02740, partial [Rhodobacteraceae bacterium]|nr:hypothetical protein [Paracoccaceae bacterium]